MDDQQFEHEVRSGEFPLAQFDHRAHLRFAFILLKRMPFLEACIVMRDALQSFAIRAGKPGLYHETITVAFMSVIAERIAAGDCASFEELFAANPELENRNLLHRYYSPEVLASPRARHQFVLSELERRT
jgi:hypothetical protein